MLLYQCRLSGRGFGVLSAVVSGDFSLHDLPLRGRRRGARAWQGKRIGMIIRDWELIPPYNLMRSVGYGQAKESR